VKTTNVADASGSVVELAGELAEWLMKSNPDASGRLVALSALVTVFAEQALGGPPDGTDEALRGLRDAAARFGMVALREMTEGGEA